jgi:adenylate cyclase
MAVDRQFAFGSFRFDGRTGQLWRDDGEVKLAPRAAAVLHLLAERAPELVTKQELLDEAWGGVAVSDDALTSCIQELRQALNDDARHPRYVETRHRRGYRLMVPARPAGDPPGATLHAPTAPRLPDKPSIVVLPFDNLSGDPSQDYLADGLVEAITAALSRIRSFFVIARNSAFTYKGRAADVRAIRNDLGVAYLLEGSVQTSGRRIRIIVQLVETEGGAHVWTASHDGTLDEIFDLQDRIAEQVAGALQPSIRIAEIERSRRKRPQDLSAYDYAMRAMPYVWALGKEESARAIELLDKALAIDPEYPLALSLAGWSHAQRAVYTWTEDIAASQALAGKLADRAADLSGDDPLVLAVLGAVHTFTRNHGTARILLERALALDPNAAWAWSRLGWGRELFRPAGARARAFPPCLAAEPARSDELQQLCRHRLVL